MGIPALEKELWSSGCVRNISIAELVRKYEKNVIVVDGFNFYGGYLYPKFDWVCVGFRELVQEIRYFVEAFERIGVKLVFFFVEGNLDEGVDSCGSETWIQRRSEFIQYTQMLFRRTSHWKNHLEHMKKNRAYYHTPLNALPVVLFALRHIFNCEVHLVYSGDRIDAVAYYSRNNDCVALLAQDNYYIFYRVPRYLSIRNLSLTNLTTVQYIPEILAQHRNLEGHLYPSLIRDTTLTSDQKEILFQIEAKLDECDSIEVARKKIKECLQGEKIEKVLDLEGLNIDETLKDSIQTFLFDILRYKLGFDYFTPSGPLKEWKLIKLKAQECFASGQMSRFIEQILLTKSYFNECILEDFTELPPSSEVYQFLRQKLYDVLFHDEPQPEVQPKEVNESNISEKSNIEVHPGALDIWERKLHNFVVCEEVHQKKKIREWYMQEEGCSCRPILVIPKLVNPALHPGLLVLWDFNNKSSNIRDIKWQLFASCISDNLQWQLLNFLPPTFIVPTVVLYYLFQVVPPMFKTKPWNFLKEWEVEVFIAQAVMLSKINTNSLSKIVIDKINPRVVKLMALFVCGCHHVRLLIEACGYPISEHDLSLFHFFDGKLFHSFYDRAEWRRNARNLCDQESSSMFERIKQIIISDI